MPGRNLGSVAAAALVFAAVLPTVDVWGQDPDAAVDPFENPYIVVDGKVDPGTYNGYRRYHSACHACHGFDGIGSSFAPALADSVKNMDYAQFMEVVVNGRQSAGATGDRVMPGFGENPNVMLHVQDIYGYLKARADGALPPGRPERIPKENAPS